MVQFSISVFDGERNDMKTSGKNSLEERMQSLEDRLSIYQLVAGYDTYEALLWMGLKAGCSVRFVDPLTGSLPWTIEDLARTRPGIRLSEIARLLNLETDLARTLAEQAMKEKGVSIDFDV